MSCISPDLTAGILKGNTMTSEELRTQDLALGTMVQTVADEKAGNQVFYRVLGDGSVSKHTKNFRIYKSDFATDNRWYSISLFYDSEADAIAVFTDFINAGGGDSCIKTIQDVRRDNFNAGFAAAPAPVCPRCKSTDLKKRGFCYTVVSKAQRYLCHDCGSWFAGRVEPLW